MEEEEAALSWLPSVIYVLLDKETATPVSLPAAGDTAVKFMEACEVWPM